MGSKNLITGIDIIDVMSVDIVQQLREWGAFGDSLERNELKDNES